LNVKVVVTSGGQLFKSAHVVSINSLGDNHLSDTFNVKLNRTESIVLTKNEIVLSLAASKETLLESSKEWDLHIALTQYRTVVTLHFLIDLEGTLAVLSKAFQGNDLTPSVVFNCIEETYLRLKLL